MTGAWKIVAGSVVSFAGSNRCRMAGALALLLLTASGLVRSSPGAEAHAGVPPGTRPETEWIPADSAWTGAPLFALWKEDLGRSIVFAPVILTGKVVAATTDRKVQCLELATGKKIWSRGFKGDVSAPVAWEATSGTHGAVFVALEGRERACVAFDVDSGHEIWREKLRSPAVFLAARDGFLWLLEKRGRLVCFAAADGSEVWSLPYGGWDAPQFLEDDGALFVAARSDSLLRIEAATGKRIWGSAPGGLFAAPPVRDGEAILLAATDGRIHRIDAATGALLPSTRREPPQLAAPALSGELAVTVSSGGVVEGGDPASEDVLWRIDLGEAVASPPVCAGPLILVSSVSGTLHALRADRGSQVWNLTPRGGFRTPPVLTPGCLVLATDRGEIYVYTHPQ